MRIMGLDYGTKTVGVALSDETGLIAQPLCTIVRQRRTKLRQTYAKIEALAAENGVESIVIGLPINMNGTEGERAEETKVFYEAVKRRTGLPVFLMDERLTTIEADRILEETGVAQSARKEHIDKMAAAIILQCFLDREFKPAPEPEEEAQVEVEAEAEAETEETADTSETAEAVEEEETAEAEETEDATEVEDADEEDTTEDEEVEDEEEEEYEEELKEA